jgi:MFS transporter, ACS family, hexuronate transporter
MPIDQPAPRIGRYRWVICALLFAATAINYIDRQTIGGVEADSAFT